MITKAYIQRGIGDALNSRDFLLTYCKRHNIKQEDITIYTSLHKVIFEDTKFKIEKSNKVNLRELTYYGNFGHFDLPKNYIDKRFDKCIARNSNIFYTFDTIIPLKWKEDISHINLPEKFITVNYGHDNNSNPTQICSKMWSLQNWEKLVSMFDIPVVQIGGGWTCKEIKGCTINLVNKLTLKQSAQVMKKALFHIDIEGGLVILGKHIGVKSVVLFGSTDINHFGRKGNLNLRNTNCKACSGSLEPNGRNNGLYGWDFDCNCKCMTDLTPEFVFQKIKENNWL